MMFFGGFRIATTAGRIYIVQILRILYPRISVDSQRPPARRAMKRLSPRGQRRQRRSNVLRACRRPPLALVRCCRKAAVTQQTFSLALSPEGSNSDEVRWTPCRAVVHDASSARYPDTNTPPPVCGAPRAQPPLVGFPRTHMHGQLCTLSTHPCSPRTLSKRVPAVDRICSPAKSPGPAVRGEGHGSCQS
jgi:hypothetical protein